MAITAGAISLVSKEPKKVVLSATPATLGTAPYTYQWYRSTVSGFTPGVSNDLVGETALDLTDEFELVPGTTYYYKLVATDAVPVSVTYTEFAVTLPQESMNPNQFAQKSLLGMLDQMMNYNTVPVEVDSSESGEIFAGMAVKIVDSKGGVPKVVKCSADSDEVFGFVNYSIKDQKFTAGMRMEVSQAGNVMYLYATTAIARGARVTLNVVSPGGVAELVGSSGDRIVGFAFDKGAVGDLIRVKLLNPSFQVA